MTMPTHDSVADYDAACSEQGRAALAVVRDLIAHLVPAEIPREERLSYGIPTLFVRGQRVVHYAAWGEHLAMYPIPPSPPGDPTLREDLSSAVKGKGTLHFPYAGLSGPDSSAALQARVVAAHLVRLGVTPVDDWSRRG